MESFIAFKLAKNQNSYKIASINSKKIKPNKLRIPNPLDPLTLKQSYQQSAYLLKITDNKIGWFEA